ncbi:saccharopine dehydrogenase-like protein [Micromonospora sp. M71_S20]|nr:saccharopine dehydrogenase-like protein [Micromonospora sp. M71_S20]
MGSGRTVAVFGAYGHTGRFVVAELCARGFVPLLCGRDADKLRTLAASFPGLGTRPASVDDPAALDRALAGAAAVVNCAGPFAVTAAPVIEAALRAGIAYVDVAAEVEANLDTFTHFADRARAAGTVVVPAMAFFGGLGDLLVTAAMGDWTAADEAHVAYGLSGWHPTAGTRAAGTVSRRRRDGRRVRYRDGRLEYRDDAPPALTWPFPEPMGTRAVIGEFTMADVVTVPSHLAIPEVCTYMTVEAAGELAAPETPAPAAVDDRGRSAQTFLVDVVVRSGGAERRAVAGGRDIYAVSAPLAVEAVHRILTGRTRTVGVASAGAVFDAPDFLRALSAHVSLDLRQSSAAPMTSSVHARDRSGTR